MQNCDVVVEAIKETGQIKRGQKDLEEQVSEPRAIRRANKNMCVQLISQSKHMFNDVR